MKAEVRADYYSLRVYINDLLHIYINKDTFIGFQAWTDNEHQSVIEFTLTTGKIKVEYDKKELWIEILQLLDKELT